MAAPRGDEDHAARLRFAARALAQARDDLAVELRRAAEEGAMSYRAMAAEVGLSPEQVRRIVRGLA